MKILIDTERQTLVCEQPGSRKEFPLYSKEAFELLSHQWLKVGWDQKYPYTFSWMGRPIVQIPEDMVRMQEVIYSIKPDVLIETGVAHGGSLVFYASLFKAMNRGRAVGIDIEIRPHNRKAIESHPLASYITLIEGSSTAPEVFDQAKAHVKPSETVMVVLDSCHAKEHVQSELEIYSPLVTPGSYIVATDGGMKDFYDVPRGKPEWRWDNPAAAAVDFASRHPEFVIENPVWPFNESRLTEVITHWPSAWLKRIS
jgi:cephalosporin hydroxylase